MIVSLGRIVVDYGEMRRRKRRFSNRLQFYVPALGLAGLLGEKK